MVQAQQPTLREPVSGRRSGSNIAASPPAPSQMLWREHNLVAENGSGQRSKSALVPSSPAYGMSAPELPPPKFIPSSMPSSVVRAASTAVGQSGSVIRAPSFVKAG